MPPSDWPAAFSVANQGLGAAQDPDGKNVGIVRKNCIEYMNGVNLFMDKLDAICCNERLVAITPDNADTLRSAMASIRETLQANIAQAAAELGRPVSSVMGEELVKWFEAIKPLMVTFMRDVIDQMMVEEPEAHTGDMSAQNTDERLQGLSFRWIKNYRTQPSAQRFIKDS